MTSAPWLAWTETSYTRAVSRSSPPLVLAFFALGAAAAISFDWLIGAFKCSAAQASVYSLSIVSKQMRHAAIQTGITSQFAFALQSTGESKASSAQAAIRGEDAGSF